MHASLPFHQLLIMTHLSLPHKRLRTLASVPQLKYSSGSMKRRVDEMTWQRTVHDGMRGLKMKLKYMKGQRIQGCYMLNRAEIIKLGCVFQKFHTGVP